MEGSDKPVRVIGSKRSRISDVEKDIIEKRTKQYDEEKNRLLLDACERGELENVVSLLKDGADIECTDDYGYTPLIAASFKEYFPLVKLLISKGANLEAKDRIGYTALIWASFKGYLSVAEELIRSGADVNARNVDNFTALFYAANNGHLSVVDELVRNGADVNVVNKYEFAPLMYAAMNGHASICIFLLLNGADTTILYQEKNFLQCACIWQGNKVQFLKEMFCTQEVTEEMMNGSLVDKVARIHFSRREAMIWMMIWKRRRNDPAFYPITRDIAKFIANKIMEDSII